VAAVVGDAVPDRRNKLLVTHSYRAMVTARMMAIAAGHEGCRPFADTRTLYKIGIGYIDFFCRSCTGRASRSNRVFTLPRCPMDWVFSEPNLLFGSVR
jgi:hypothetical protein